MMVPKVQLEAPGCVIESIVHELRHKKPQVNDARDSLAVSICEHIITVYENESAVIIKLDGNVIIHHFFPHVDCDNIVSYIKVMIFTIESLESGGNTWQLTG